MVAAESGAGRASKSLEAPMKTTSRKSAPRSAPAPTPTPGGAPAPSTTLSTAPIAPFTGNMTHEELGQILQQASDALREGVSKIPDLTEILDPLSKKAV